MNGSWIGLTLCGLLALPAVIAPSVASAATPQPTQSAAKVNVDLELRKGDAAATSTAVVETGAEANFEFGDAREVKLTIDAVDGDTLRVKFSMSKGGKTVVKARTVEAAAGKSQQIKLGKGRTLTLKLSPKKHRIELPDSNEPLAGL